MLGMVNVCYFCVVSVDGAVVSGAHPWLGGGICQLAGSFFFLPCQRVIVRNYPPQICTKTRVELL